MINESLLGNHVSHQEVFREKISNAVSDTNCLRQQCALLICLSLRINEHLVSFWCVILKRLSCLDASSNTVGYKVAKPIK